MCNDDTSQISEITYISTLQSIQKLHNFMYVISMQSSGEAITSMLYRQPGGVDSLTSDNTPSSDPNQTTLAGYIIQCTKFGQLILRKIIKIVATRCQILRLKCTKSFVGWGSAPDPAKGAYSAPQIT